MNGYRKCLYWIPISAFRPGFLFTPLKNRGVDPFIQDCFNILLDMILKKYKIFSSFRRRFKLYKKNAMERAMDFWRVPLDIDAIQVPRGIVTIFEDRCKGCGYCITFCPRHVLNLASRFNVKGYHPPEVIRADDCVNCRFCEIICPEFAIYSTEASTDSPASRDMMTPPSGPCSYDTIKET